MIHPAKSYCTLALTLQWFPRMVKSLIAIDTSSMGGCGRATLKIGNVFIDVTIAVEFRMPDSIYDLDKTAIYMPNTADKTHISRL